MVFFGIEIFKNEAFFKICDNPHAMIHISPDSLENPKI